MKLTFQAAISSLASSIAAWSSLSLQLRKDSFFKFRVKITSSLFLSIFSGVWHSERSEAHGTEPNLTHAVNPHDLRAS